MRGTDKALFILILFIVIVFVTDYIFNFTSCMKDSYSEQFANIYSEHFSNKPFEKDMLTSLNPSDL